MGLLDKNYYDDLLNEGSAQNTPTSAPVQPQPMAQSTPEPTPAPTPTPTQKFPRLTPEAQVERNGGVVGSPEYYKKQSERGVISRLPGEVFGAFGAELPPQEVWDTMSRNEQAMTITGESLKIPVKIVFGLPKAIGSVGVGLWKTAGETWGKITGKEPAPKPVADPDKPVSFYQSVPSYYGTYEEARAKGMGPLSSSVMVFGRAGGDATILYSVAGALKNSFAPRAQTLKPGAVLDDTKAVEQELFRRKADEAVKVKSGDVTNPSEYHPLTSTDAKQFGGPLASSSNTFFKFTPAALDGSKVELSIVKLDSGIKNLFNKAKEKLGGESNSNTGKYGPETKLYSQVIDVKKEPNMSLVPEEGMTVKPTVPTAPLKGFEKKPVTTENIANLDAIGKFNQLDPELQSGVIKALTGKDVVGNLTQAEYVNVAKTMANLSKASVYAPESIGFGNWMKNYFSPTRYWTRDVQTRTGIPVHDAHMQMETGYRVAKVSEQAKLGELYANPVIEKYAGGKFSGERALVKEYLEGNTAAITDNPALSTATKNELMEAAGIFDKYMKNVADDIGMDPKVFIENYAPHVQERGGVFQLYKEPGNLPKGSEPFFQEKRSGGLYTQINDMWALADIYTRSAYKSKYLGPALDKANEVGALLPSGVKERFASYVQEKLGYGGKLEKVMDSTAQSLNQKLGWNLPPDTARVMTQEALSTMYSSAMSQPATWVRNSFQYPTMGFAQWGSKFMGDAMRKAYSKEGMAEFQKSGFSVDLGVPFGEEVIQATTGSKIRAGYNQVTQGILKPNGWIENRNRAPMYFQTKMIFDDTISKVNQGKLTWTQAEKELGLNTMHQADANLIRQDLVKGDLKGAFEKLAQNAIDDTQFPYRRGESWRLGYGMAGKIGTPFMQWPVEYIHTLSKWASTGQWDKLARWYGSTTLLARTFEQSFNTDFGPSLGLGPLGNLNFTPPPVSVIQNGMGLIYNQISDNEQAYEKNAEELFKSLRLAIPGGVEGANIIKAYKAYQNGPVGPGGTYALPDASGRPNYYSFKDLFWGALGMPTLQKTENQNLQKEMASDKFDYSRAKKEVLHLYQDGMSSISAGEASGQKYIDQANKLIEEYAQKGFDLSPSDDDFNKFYIPATEQSWQSLPEALKAKYAPRVFKDPGR